MTPQSAQAACTPTSQFGLCLVPGVGDKAVDTSAPPRGFVTSNPVITEVVNQNRIIPINDVSDPDDQSFAVGDIESISAAESAPEATTIGLGTSNSPAPTALGPSLIDVADSASLQAEQEAIEARGHDVVSREALADMLGITSGNSTENTGGAAGSSQSQNSGNQTSETIALEGNAQNAPISAVESGPQATVETSVFGGVLSTLDTLGNAAQELGNTVQNTAQESFQNVQDAVNTAVEIGKEMGTRAEQHGYVNLDALGNAVETTVNSIANALGISLSDNSDENGADNFVDSAADDPGYDFGDFDAGSQSSGGDDAGFDADDPDGDGSPDTGL